MGGVALGFRQVLGLLVRFAWLVAWLVALPWLLARRVVGRTRRGPTSSWRSRARWPRFSLHAAGGLPRRRALSLHGLRELVDELAHDDHVRGLIVVIKSMQAGLATATSLRSVLARAQSAGKRIVVHLPLGGGSRETYVAMRADRVILGPSAGLAPVGFLMSARYLQGRRSIARGSSRRSTRTGATRRRASVSSERR